MKNSLIRTINSEMNSYLNNYQLEKLNEILEENCKTISMSFWHALTYQARV